ncbi:Rho guanine nucleotide exchange factor 7 [Paragonimus westermani]|uniref:Rho guanine nucleotide exchange factor 7 n=1 Tax=Paragonimus westermani TaxID=34504 RepID=A0A5J4NU85_9TREM|nr:Rho guanine nucleotide exchange factor 7 [Paragonimus westermani]
MAALPIMMSPTIASGSDQLSVLVMFPACVLLLTRTKQPDVYEFTVRVTMKLPLKCLTVLGCFETETDIELTVTPCSTDRESVHPCRISLRCTDQNARDLLVSTLTDLIHYQTHIEQSASGSRAAFSYCESMVSQSERMSYHRHTAPTEGGSAETSTDKLSTPVSERTQSSLSQQNARDLLVSTLTDLIHYQTPIEQSASGSRAAFSYCDSMASQSERMSYHRHIAPTEGGSAETSTGKLSTPISERTQSSSSQQINAAHISVTIGSCASPRDVSPSALSTDNSAESREVSPPAPTNNRSSVQSSSEAPTINSTNAHRSSSPSLPAGLQYLPHQITTSAHVRLFDQSDSRENGQPLPPSVVQCLRLDGPLDVNHNTYWSSRVCSYMNLGGPSAPQVLSSGPKFDADLSGAGRLHSPKGDGVKELRRKKSDPLQFICGRKFLRVILPACIVKRVRSMWMRFYVRLENCVNPIWHVSLSPVFVCSRSLLLHINRLLALTDDNERRTADAARVLQVVEAYCASAWTQLSCRALDSCSSKSRDPDKHVCSAAISPTESKTLLQQFTSPTLISSVHQDTDPKRHSEVVLTSAELKSSARTGLSASAFVRGVAKRSGSKNKADLVHTQSASVSRSSPLPLAAHDSIPTESVVQNMSPPPVILPTRSGRRL